jgi:hypothetical protein
VICLKQAVHCIIPNSLCHRRVPAACPGWCAVSTHNSHEKGTSSIHRADQGLLVMSTVQATAECWLVAMFNAQPEKNSQQKGKQHPQGTPVCLLVLTCWPCCCRPCCSCQQQYQTGGRAGWPGWACSPCKYSKAPDSTQGHQTLQ